MLELEHAPVRALSALGARLYRLQQSAPADVRREEWQRIWQTYHARRTARAA